MLSHDVTQLAHDGTTALPKFARKPYMQIGSKVLYCHLNERRDFLIPCQRYAGQEYRVLWERVWVKSTKGYYFPRLFETFKSNRGQTKHLI